MSEVELNEPPRTGGYSVTLPTFEGPLDLLLHLCQKHELDILDIPIGFVTEKYLEYLAVMQLLDLDVASEYLVMAATLAHIKSKMLLPAPPPGQEDELSAEEQDPRGTLIRRLLEYQKYKQAGEELAARGVAGRDVFLRGMPIDEAVQTGLPPLAQVPLFSLVEAFQNILSKSKVKLSHDIVHERVTLADRINELVDILRVKRRVTFEELFVGLETRFDLVITFLALLEMTRLRMTRLFQADFESPIIVEFTAQVAADEDVDPTATANLHGDAILEGSPLENAGEVERRPGQNLSEATSSLGDHDAPGLGDDTRERDVVRGDSTSERVSSLHDDSEQALAGDSRAPELLSDDSERDLRESSASERSSEQALLSSLHDDSVSDDGEREFLGDDSKRALEKELLSSLHDDSVSDDGEPEHLGDDSEREFLGDDSKRALEKELLSSLHDDSVSDDGEPEHLGDDSKRALEKELLSSLHDDSVSELEWQAGLQRPQEDRINDTEMPPAPTTEPPCAESIFDRRSTQTSTIPSPPPEDEAGAPTVHLDGSETAEGGEPSDPSVTERPAAPNADDDAQDATFSQSILADEHLSGTLEAPPVSSTDAKTISGIHPSAEDLPDDRVPGHSGADSLPSSRTNSDNFVVEKEEAGASAIEDEDT